MHTVKYIFAFSIAVAALAASGVFAQVGSQVSFPIPELGNCVGKTNVAHTATNRRMQTRAMHGRAGAGLMSARRRRFQKKEVQADVRRRRSVVRIAIIRNTKISVLIFPFLEDS